MGLEPAKYRQRKPKELSGGEQQRVGVVRALAADPEIILMDEPFSALDPISRTKLQDDLLEMQRTIQKTIVFVSHDMQEALKLGDRLCIMKDGEIVQIGTPQQLLQNPVNDFVQQFIGGKQSDQLFTIHDVLQPIIVTNDFGHTIPVDAPFPTILEKLAEHDLLGVEENGKLIGMVTRASTLRYLAADSKKRGHVHGG